MNIFNIFPNPIFIENCPYKDLVEEVVTDSLKNFSLSKNENCPNLFHLDNELKKSFLKNPKLEKFNDWIVECCNYYVTDVLGYELSDTMLATDSWLNVCNKGGYQVFHHHTNSYISGTYYVNIEENHAPLMFRHVKSTTHTPVQSLSLNVDSRKSTLYNSDASFMPKNGQLFLWQSHLTHGYFFNEKDNRISISMNFLPKIISNYRYGFEISTHE